LAGNPKERDEIGLDPTGALLGDLNIPAKADLIPILTSVQIYRDDYSFSFKGLPCLAE